MEAIDKSTVTGVNYGKVVGLHNGTVLVKTYNCTSHLGRYFRKINGASKFRHFCFSKHHRGKVFCRESADSPEEEFELLKKRNDLPPSILPPQVVPGGLDEECKSYLFREIRQFCQPGTENAVALALGDS